MRERLWKLGRRLGVLLIVAALVVAGGALVKHKKDQLEAAPRPTARPTPVRTAIAATGALADTRTYLATVVPWQAAEVAAQLTARIESVTVREGDPVRAGQVLVTLDDSVIGSERDELEARIAQARAEIEAQVATADTLSRSVQYWKDEVKRDESLSGSGVVARARYEERGERLNTARGSAKAARRSIEAARKQLLSLEKRREGVDARLAWATVVAPFDGVVTRRAVDPGDLAAPGRVLVVVEARDRVKLTFAVPQEDVAGVRPGGLAHVGTGSERRTLPVARLYPSLNADRTLTVELDAPAQDFRSGAWFPVELELRRLDGAVLVPEAALVDTPDGGHAVFAVAAGRTAPTPVEVLLVRDGRAAVTGVDAGAEVVVSTYLGWNRLAGGEPVEVLR